jgi:hypothetical protein
MERPIPQSESSGILAGRYGRQYFVSSLLGAVLGGLRTFMNVFFYLHGS